MATRSTNSAAVRHSTPSSGPQTLKTSLTKTSAASYTVLMTDSLIAQSNASGAVVLPSAPLLGAGREFTIKNSGSGTVTVSAVAGTVEATSLAAGVAKRYVSDGTNWTVFN